MKIDSKAKSGTGSETERCVRVTVQPMDEVIEFARNWALDEPSEVEILEV